MNTKKSLITVSLSALFLISAPYAIAATCDPAAGYFCNPLNTGGEGTDTVADFIILAIQFLMGFVGIISLFFLVLGGIRYMVAAGNQDSIATAKRTVTSSLIGLILAFIAFSIVTALEQILRVRS